MRTLMNLLLGIAMLAGAAATEIEPPKLLVKGNAWMMREGSEPRELRAVDVSRIIKSNPTWTEASLKALFRSIDPEKIKYADGDGGRIKTQVTMIEPIKIRFTFEARHNDEAKRNRMIPSTSYWLIGVQRLTNEEAQQGGSGQPAPHPHSKSPGGDKPQPDAEGRSR